jgi:hypothetical protein
MCSKYPEIVTLSENAAYDLASSLNNAPSDFNSLMNFVAKQSLPAKQSKFMGVG